MDISFQNEFYLLIQMGEHTKMSELKQCCLCRNPLDADNSFGHNPFPLCDVDDYESRACNRCNAFYVVDARIRCMTDGEERADSPEKAAVWCRPYRDCVRRKEIAKHLLAIESGENKEIAIEKFKERIQKANNQMVEEMKRLTDTS